MERRSAGCQFVLDTAEPLIDEPVSARLVGLEPGTRVTITAVAHDREGTRFASVGEYAAGAGGEVDPGRQASLGGGYDGVDGFGLWWSMASDADGALAGGIDPVPTELIATVDGRTVAEAAFRRVWVGEGVTVTPVRERGLVATRFAPLGGPSPAVMVLGGSGGGYHRCLEVAALLASRGFVTMAVAYFGLPGLPPSLVNIPLEYFGPAIRLLGDRVGVIGTSRGAELALLLGTVHPEIAAVVGLAPSTVLWGTPFLASAGGEPVPAWTRGGRGLPCIGFEAARSHQLYAAGATMDAVFLDALSDAGRAEAAIIPVERLAGPALLISGGEDRIWPSQRFAEMAMARLNGRHLHYPDAGHAAGQPPGLPASSGFIVHPMDGRTYATGGTRRANAASSADAWPQVLEFLHAHLG